MKYFLVVVLFLIVPSTFLMKSSLESESQPERMKVYDFCSVSTDQKVWNRSTIESKLSSLIEKPPVHNTTLESYPNAYITMTGERDKARCGNGPLVSGYEISNYINHLLSDIMTRYLQKITHDCANNPSLSIENFGICYNQKQFLEQSDMDSISSFMDSTSVYISSHIALSLSAVILNDSFWKLSSYSQTYPKEQLYSAISNRAFFVKRYKPSYDAFNEFLVANLKTVSSALYRECLINHDFLVKASGIGKKIPLSASLFGKIRDKAFNMGLKLAKDFAADPSKHPMIVKQNGVYTVDFTNYDYDYIYPKDLKDLESYSKASVLNPISAVIYRNILGGLTTSQIEAKRKTCDRD